MSLAFSVREKMYEEHSSSSLIIKTCLLKAFAL